MIRKAGEDTMKMMVDVSNERGAELSESVSTDRGSNRLSIIMVAAQDLRRSNVDPIESQNLINNHKYIRAFYLSGQTKGDFPLIIKGIVHD